MEGIVVLLISIVAPLFIASVIADFFEYSLDWGSCLIGILTAAITSLVLVIVRGWFSTARRPNQEQVASVSTNETPRQITRAAFRAKVMLFLFYISLIVLAYLYVRHHYF